MACTQLQLQQIVGENNQASVAVATFEGSCMNNRNAGNTSSPYNSYGATPTLTATLAWSLFDIYLDRAPSQGESDYWSGQLFNQVTDANSMNNTFRTCAERQARYPDCTF